MMGGMGWIHGGIAVVGILLVAGLILGTIALVKYLRSPG
jgi:hypothetical protein